MLTVDFDRIGMRPGMRILDIGCGSGRHSGGAMGYTDIEVVAADRSFDDLKAAQERIAFHRRVGADGGGPVWIIASDIRVLPFAEGCFDLVICAEVLEHIKNDEKALAQLYRVLKPGGQLVVSVPRFYPEWICWQLDRNYPDPDGGGHLRIYRKPQLFALLQKAGFHCRACHYAHSLHTPFWWLKCLLGTKYADTHPLVRLYNRFLTWDILRRPRITALLDRLLNPLLGKSLVIYTAKQI